MAIQFSKTSDRYNFFMEKPTQSSEKSVLIAQSEMGLKIFVKENGDKIYPVERWKVKGMQKSGLVPREFFEKCVAFASKNHSVTLNQPLKGGMLPTIFALGTFIACKPGDNNNHTHSTTTTRENTTSGEVSGEVSSSALNASSQGTGSTTNTVISTEYYQDCRDSNCPTSSTNPTNQSERGSTTPGTNTNHTHSDTRICTTHAQGQLEGSVGASLLNARVQVGGQSRTTISTTRYYEEEKKQEPAKKK